jgi:hypothetical protein
MTPWLESARRHSSPPIDGAMFLAFVEQVLVPTL